MSITEADLSAFTRVLDEIEDDKTMSRFMRINGLDTRDSYDGIRWGAAVFEDRYGDQVAEIPLDDFVGLSDLSDEAVEALVYERSERREAKRREREEAAARAQAEYQKALRRRQYDLLKAEFETEES